MAAQADVDWQQRALDAEAEVARLRKRNRELEDELDLLAVANADLRAMAAPAAPAPAPAGPPLESFAALRVHGASRALRSEPDSIVEQASGTANATCVALHSEHGLVCGGADGVLRLHKDGADPIQHACGSPPLRLAFHGDFLACGCMDGTVRFYHTSKLSSFDPKKDELPDILPALDEYHRARDHTARIVSIAWGEPFGQYNDIYIATCARDKTVIIYDANASPICPLHTLVLPANPESLCFAPGGKELIVYCRGEPFRRHLKIEEETLAETRVSLNANDWDTHCSFAVLDMAVSPDGNYLACATDANKHIIYPLHGNEHVKVLVGHSADEYANARIAWLGESVVSNSQKDPGLYQWDIGSGKILTRVERAHAKAVRDLAVADGTLATCSFDKAAKLWSLCASIDAAPAAPPPPPPAAEPEEPMPRLETTAATATDRWVNPQVHEQAVSRVHRIADRRKADAVP